MSYYEEQHPDLTPQLMSSFKIRLEERLTQLQQASHRSQLSRATVDLDQSRVGRLSRMDALQMQAMEQANEMRRLEEIDRIQQALVKIAEQDFGSCDICGSFSLQIQQNLALRIVQQAKNQRGLVVRGSQIRGKIGTSTQKTRAPLHCLRLELSA